ncbi:MAG: AMIN domain-containing protein [candidate division Zixibacteria bacterium]|nr:AMIN domain-containing protein [candidate division Zixibacteria bacterium]
MNIRYITILIIGIILMAAPAVLANTNVNTLNLERVGSETVLKIDASGPFQFTHQVEDAKDGKPFRVIVDLFPTVHNLGQKVFTGFPASIVKAIRTSQYAVKPEKVVRIVLDLQKSAVYRIEKNGNSVLVHLPDKENSGFSEWSSQSSKISANTMPITAPVAGKSVPSVSMASKDIVKSITADTVKSVTAVASKAKDNKPIEVASVASKEIIQSVKSKTTDVTAPVQNNKVSENKAPVVAVATKHINPKQSSDIDKERIATPIQKKETVAATVTLMAKSEEKPAGNKSPEADSSRIAVNKLAIATAKPPVENKDMTAKVEPPKQTESKSAEVKLAVATEPNKSMDEEKGKAEQITTKVNTENIYYDSDAVASEESTDNIPAVERPGISSDTTIGNKPTSRFRREPVLPNKLKGTIVAEFPKRMLIDYAPGDFRDPFETLIDETKQTEGMRENRIPEVETSRLVGVLESSNGSNRVLLEDVDGFGYILKTGDKVKKGFVDRIETDRAFFQLFEYGWSRTVALYLGHN